MNLFDRATVGSLRSWQNIQFTRLERIKKEGSEPFTWQVPATGPTASAFIEIANQFPRARKYQPLDFLELANNDVVDLTLRINGDIQYPVPAGTIRQVLNQALWTLQVTNLHAATTSTLNKITVTVKREALTIDDWARGRR